MVIGDVKMMMHLFSNISEEEASLEADITVTKQKSSPSESADSVLTLAQ